MTGSAQRHVTVVKRDRRTLTPTNGGGYGAPLTGWDYSDRCGGKAPVPSTKIGFAIDRHGTLDFEVYTILVAKCWSGR
jgi:hypothetical protein